MSVWRKDFPALASGTYLDSAATAHKPQIVIDTVSQLMGEQYATVSRGLYKASQDMTLRYEGARNTIAAFIKARNDEIVFTRNATEGINLLARSLVNAGDKVTITQAEHHANIVPWQLVKAQLNVLPVLETGELDTSQLDKYVTPETKIFSFTALSNVLGIINPVADIVKAARAINPEIIIIVDASQAAVHGAIDVKKWDCDFLVFTGHKLYGPTGIGVLYGKAEKLNALPPFLGGGDMVETVTFEQTTYKNAPHKFEAGTPNFIEAIGLAAAISYMETIGWDNIAVHEAVIKEKLFSALDEIDGLNVAGQAPNRIGLASFSIKNLHPQDVAMILDQMGIAVRVGHHCAMPLLARLGHSSLIRVSTALYTNEEDIAKLQTGLLKAERMLS